MPNTQFIEDHKQENLEIALDHLCKATGRDIAIFFPTKAEEIVPYLIKEIKLTIKEFDEDDKGTRSLNRSEASELISKLKNGG